MLNNRKRGPYPGPNESSNWRATARFTEGLKKLHSFQELKDRRFLGEAENMLREAVVTDPGYEAARFYLGVTHELKGQHRDAAYQFEELLAAGARAQTELFYNAGLAYFHLYSDQAYEKAEHYLNKATETAKDASGDDQDTERRRAIGVLAQVVLAQVYSHRAILPVGETRDHLKPTAEDYYEKALKTATDALKTFESSQKTIEELDPIFKNDIGWGIYNARGHARMYAAKRSQDPAEKDTLIQAALAEFKEALKFDPNNMRVLSNIGSAKLFGAQGQTDPARRSELLAEAEHEFERVLALQPDYDFAYCRLAQIEVERRHFEAARKYAELAETHPSEMKPQYIKELKSKIEKEANSSHIYTLKINPSKVGGLIGPGGKTIRGIIEQTGVKIDVEDDGRVNVAATDEPSASKALKMIRDLLAEAEVGKTYLGKVVRLADFGAFVEIFPGTEGLLHISEVAEHRIRDIRDALKLDDLVLVKVISVEGNKVRLSRKAVLSEQREKTSAEPETRS